MTNDELIQGMWADVIECVYKSRTTIFLPFLAQEIIPGDLFVSLLLHGNARLHRRLQELSSTAARQLNNPGVAFASTFKRYCVPSNGVLPRLTRNFLITHGFKAAQLDSFLQEQGIALETPASYAQMHRYNGRNLQRIIVTEHPDRRVEGTSIVASDCSAWAPQAITCTTYRPTSLCPQVRFARNEETILHIKNAGKGIRQGLLSACAGFSKGHIRLFGHSIGSISARLTAALFSGLPSAQWIVDCATDVFLIADDEICARIAEQVRRTEADLYVWYDPGVMSLGGYRRSWRSIHGALDAAAELPWVGRRVRAVVEEEAKSKNLKSTINKYGGKEFPWHTVIKSTVTHWLSDDFYIELADESENFEPNILNCVVIPFVFDEQVAWMAVRPHDISKESWEEIWQRSQEMRQQGVKIEYLPLPRYWFDLDTPLEIFNFYEFCVNTDDRALHHIIPNICGVEDGNLSQSIHGNHHFVDEKRILIRDSRIDIEEGVTLEFGTGVVIDNSVLEITGRRGTTVVIPDGTKIVQSAISGNLSGLRERNLLYAVKGIRGRVTFPMVSDALFTAWVDEDGPCVLVHQSLDFDPKGIDHMLRKRNSDKPIPNLGSKTLADLFNGYGRPP